MINLANLKNKLSNEIGASKAQQFTGFISNLTDPNLTIEEKKSLDVSIDF